MSALTEIGEEAFKTDVLGSPQPVLVDFSATWCGPCKALAPTLDQLAAEYQGRVRMFKVDVDNSTGLASEYGVMSVPTLLFFNKGEIADQTIGAVPKESIKRTLDKLLSGAASTA
jgi:thioredoxin 1